MAVRALLHKNHLNDLKIWLETQGYMILDANENACEVLRAKKGRDTIIIYCRLSAKEHLSVMDKDYMLIRRFVRQLR